MKNLIIILIHIVFPFSVFSQGHTRITIKISHPDTIPLSARVFVEDPLQPIRQGYYEDTVAVENGHCEFYLDIKNPSLMTLIVNDKYVTFPGSYSVVIEPEDDLVFNLPPLKEASNYGFGIPNINIGGKGSSKVNMAKNMWTKCLEIYNTDPAYQTQSLTYQFETTDRKLNAINSIYNENKSIPRNIREIIKAQVYGSILESLFRSCVRSESDSVRLLFDKYIVKKKRMDVFFKKDVIKYASNFIPYLLLSEFRNPVKFGGEFFSKKHKIAYAEIVARRLSSYPEMRDYLLSKHLMSSILNGFDSTTAKLYQFYLDNADFNNPNYSTVIKTYEEIEGKFAVGKNFYNFSLPDSTGKIYSLSDFRGKVLVIDFWFNGCGGCRLMVPALKQVEKELAGSEVQFISIGIDSRDDWLKGIGKYSSANSLQLYTNGQTNKHPMIQYLNIRSYPRLIIVDQNGKILPAPSDPRSDPERFVYLIRSYL